jgi:hypothetical protein
MVRYYLSLATYCQGLTEAAKLDVPKANKPIKPVTSINSNAGREPPSKKRYYLTPEPAPGTCYLADIASVIRSKNSGPYELTFDIMFDDKDTYEQVKRSNILTQAMIAKLYHLKEQDVIASLFWDQALAYKATIVRPAVSGGFGESDTHGSQQHAPLLYLVLPFGRSEHGEQVSEAPCD